MDTCRSEKCRYRYLHPHWVRWVLLVQLLSLMEITFPWELNSSEEQRLDLTWWYVLIIATGYISHHWAFLLSSVPTYKLLGFSAELVLQTISLSDALERISANKHGFLLLQCITKPFDIVSLILPRTSTGQRLRHRVNLTELTKPGSFKDFK